MGAITKAQQEKKTTFAALVKAVGPQLQAVMPKGFEATRLTQMAIAAYTQTPNLMDCDTASILRCCLQCASLGIEPSAVDGLGRAYIIPFKNKGSYEAQFILGKNGMVELVQRSGQVSSLRTQCVYEGDEFDYWEDEAGLHFSYRPNLEAEHSEETLRLVYLSARLKDGGTVFLPMSKAEVERVKKRSKSANASYSPWASDYEAMAEKTVLRRAFNRGMLPRSVEVARGVAQDESVPVVLDADGYQVFGTDGPAQQVEAEVVDAQTGEVGGSAVAPSVVG